MRKKVFFSPELLPLDKVEQLNQQQKKDCQDKTRQSFYRLF